MNEEELEDPGVIDKEEEVDLLPVMKQLLNQVKDMQERLDYYENRRDGGGVNPNESAALRMVNLTYDTDDQHLPELTRIPIQAASVHALGMTLESLTEEGVINLQQPLSRILRNNYFRLMRSVNGTHLGRGVRLAEEQASAAQEDKAEEREFGHG